MLIDVVLRALRVSCKCFKHWPAAFDSRCRKCEYVNVQFMKPHHSQTVSFRLVHSYQRVSHSMDSREVWFEVLYENLVWKSFMKIVKFDLRSCMKIWYENREVWFQVMYENLAWKSWSLIGGLVWKSCVKIFYENREVWFEVLYENLVWKSCMKIVKFDLRSCMKIRYENREVLFQVMYENRVWKSCMKIVVWLEVLYENLVWKSFTNANLVKIGLTHRALRWRRMYVFFSPLP